MLRVRDRSEIKASSLAEVERGTGEERSASGSLQSVQVAGTNERVPSASTSVK